MTHQMKFLACIISLSLAVSAQQSGKTAPAKPAAHDSAATATVQIQSPDSIIPSPDTTGLIHDTAAVKSSDSLKTVPQSAKTDTADSLEQEDTSYTFWLHPFWGAGAGFTLGSFPVFDVWQRGLPDSLGVFGIPKETVIKGIFPDGDTLDTLRIVYEEKELPNPYTICFPITFSRYFATSEKACAAVDLSMFMLYKKLQAAVRDDSSTNRVSLRQSFGFYSCALGLRYQRAIPERYFTIGDLNRSSLSIGADIHPLVYLKRKNKVSVENNADTAFNDFRHRVSSALSDYSSFGFGISWKAGVTAIKKYSSYTGLEAGLLYTGQWFTFPGMPENKLDPGARSDKKSYSFICHRLAIQMALLRGAKKKKE